MVINFVNKLKYRKIKILKSKLKKEDILNYQSKKHKNSFIKLNTSLLPNKTNKKKFFNTTMIFTKKKRQELILESQVHNNLIKKHDFQKFTFFKKCKFY
jgi:hypothetical protein